ncbi:MAG: transglycosylase SLT domain-containing protein [Acidobacteriia bacterium]|nr:transglycosylase SLT domain-containing protein [Terriglobia bacterium]
MTRRRVWIGIGLVVLLAAAAGSWLNYRTTRFDEIIGQAAAQNDVDFYLVKAIVYEESWFRPEIQGASGELGLMQVTMRAATDFTAHNGFPPINDEMRLLEPRLNVEIGCWYLRQSLDLYKLSPDPVLFALLRYNAGEARADNWLRLAVSKPVPAGASPENYYLSLVDFPITRNYVRRILQRSRSRNYWF